MQSIWSCHNVVKEPICTIPWQSLALDQLKYLQITVINQLWNKTLESTINSMLVTLVLLHPTSGVSEIHFDFQIQSEIAEILLWLKLLTNRINNKLERWFNQWACAEPWTCPFKPEKWKGIEKEMTVLELLISNILGHHRDLEHLGQNKSNN